MTVRVIVFDECGEPVFSMDRPAMISDVCNPDGTASPDKVEAFLVGAALADAGDYK